MQMPAPRTRCVPQKDVIFAATSLIFRDSFRRFLSMRYVRRRSAISAREVLHVIHNNRDTYLIRGYAGSPMRFSLVDISSVGARATAKRLRRPLQCHRLLVKFEKFIHTKLKLNPNGKCKDYRKRKILYA